MQQLGAPVGVAEEEHPRFHIGAELGEESEWQQLLQEGKALAHTIRDPTLREETCSIIETMITSPGLSFRGNNTAGVSLMRMLPRLVLGTRQRAEQLNGEGYMQIADDLAREQRAVTRVHIALALERYPARDLMALFHRAIMDEDNGWSLLTALGRHAPAMTDTFLAAYDAVAGANGKPPLSRDYVMEQLALGMGTPLKPADTEDCPEVVKVELLRE